MTVPDYPDNPREGTEAHESAVRRLDAARSDQHDKSEAHDCGTRPSD
jgi:hypothetical protein